MLDLELPIIIVECKQSIVVALQNLYARDLRSHDSLFEDY